jgi:hypothetical protein
VVNMAVYKELYVVQVNPSPPSSVWVMQMHTVKNSCYTRTRRFIYLTVQCKIIFDQQNQPFQSIHIKYMLKDALLSLSMRQM